MFCVRCGSEIPHEDNYCHKCGYRSSTLNIASVDKPLTDEEVEAQIRLERLPGTARNLKNVRVMQNTKNNGTQSPWWQLQRILGVIIVVAIYVISYAFGRIFWVPTLIWGFAYFSARYLTKWLLSKNFFSPKIKRFIGWSNILTWLIPPLGIFTAAMTLTLIEDTPPQQIKKFKILSWACFCLSAVNGLFGVWLRLKQ